MNLLERIQLLEARDKAKAKRIARLEAKLATEKPKEKKKSRYVPKIKGNYSKEAFHARIDNKFKKVA